MTDELVEPRTKSAAIATFVSMVLWGLIAAGILLLTSGCHIVTLNDGEVGFKQTTSWSFYHVAKQTGSIPSDSGVEFQAFEDWLRSKVKKPVEPQAVVTSESKTTTVQPVVVVPPPAPTP